ncbi:MAG: hypothetical protein NC912_03760 [Candidatus Omnitrophica bacterium]|nr:hypothetical protein [Candidatus Omnitrophota bacterium]
MLRNRKGQSMAEYAIIFGVVIAAAVGISALIKEGIQDRVVSEMRKIGDDQPLSVGARYDISVNVNRNRQDSSSRNVTQGGGVDERETINVTSTSTETYRAGN